MKRFIILDKKVGETPLSATLSWKEQNPEYANVSASYAGRLDPMASGKLLVLIGEECKRQKDYINLDKEYEIEVLLDTGSDTGDVLGMPEYADKETSITDNLLKKILIQESGAHVLEYPKYSSKTVNGKPLFLHTLEGKSGDMKIPEHIEHIYKIQNRGSYDVSSSELESRIYKLLDLVPRTNEPSKKIGENFRVDAIREHWESLFYNMHERNFMVLRLRVTCASGTYMRSLAGRLGTALGTRALTLSIKRTRIGKYYSILGLTGFWTQTY